MIGTNYRRAYRHCKLRDVIAITRQKAILKFPVEKLSRDIT